MERVVVTVGERPLTFAEVVAVARPNGPTEPVAGRAALPGAGAGSNWTGPVEDRIEEVPGAPGVRVALSGAAVERLEQTRRLIAAAAEGEAPVYGITTGFGALANTRIPRAARIQLQHALLRSHAAGMGAPVEPEVVRAMLLLRAATLARGYSGVRPVVVGALLDLLNAGITPWVPEYGSLGASGDLAPLAHAALCLTGEGWVLAPASTVPGPASGNHPAQAPARAGETRQAAEAPLAGPDGAAGASGWPWRRGGAAEALAAAGLAPIELEPKEGLALLNGTEGMLGMLVLACVDLARLLRTAELTAAMSIEALFGRANPFQPELHAIRPHPGQAASAANLQRLLRGSEILAARQPEDLVQDAYALRCTPQVIGAARDTLAFAEAVATRELAAAVDNPVVLPDGRVESTGNFHGQPLAFALDFLAIAAAEVGAIAERRIDRTLDVKRSRGLPPFLTPEAGVNSGLMIAQYTAAALVAENRRLAQPASVDSLPTSAMQEDHVSLGWHAARKLRRQLANLGRILAIEAVCAAAGIDFRRPLRPAPPIQAAWARLRREVPGPGPDRFLAPDLEAAERLVWRGELLGAAEAVLGRLE